MINYWIKSLVLALALASIGTIPYEAFGASTTSNFIKNWAVEQGVSKTLDSTTVFEDKAVIEGATKSAVAAGTIGAATASAAAAGAGSLMGYAGMASAISSLGLSSITGVIGSALAGHAVAGAAATAVCTTAVGGPVVMGALVVGAIGATGYGIYKGAEYAGDYIKGTTVGKWTTDKVSRGWDWLKSKW